MRVPLYRRHTKDDVAFVEFRGKRHRLPGPYGSAQSKSAYRQFLREYVFADEPERPPAFDAADSPSIAALVLTYLDFAVNYYGEASRNEYANMRYALAQLVESFGADDADEFGPKKLKELQTILAAKKIGRGYVNATIGRVKRMFRWAASEELVPPSLYHGLQCVDGLRAGRSPARERKPRGPVAAADVEAVLPYLTPNVAGIVRVAALTGARVGSVVQAARDQFRELADGSGLWEWRPRHKRESFGQELVIYVGPRCQAVLRPFFDALARRADSRPSDPLFSPRSIRSNAKYRPTYTTNGVGEAIKRAVAKINAERAAATPPLPAMSPWSPHQLRHARGQGVRERFGLEAAQATLGHESIDATQIYARRRDGLAREVARETG